VALDGSKQLEQQTARVTSRLEAELRTVARNTAGRMKTGAQARVRVRTGQTKTRIVVVEQADKKQFSVEVEDIPGRNPMVPVWIEFGTRKMPAQPFMGPAADAERDQYRADGEAACARVLEQA
jgi:HK97 gp10 family phage protein